MAVLWCGSLLLLTIRIVLQRNQSLGSPCQRVASANEDRLLVDNIRANNSRPCPVDTIAAAVTAKLECEAVQNWLHPHVYCCGLTVLRSVRIECQQYRPAETLGIP